MSKYIRQKHIRHDPILNTPTIIEQNQCRTQLSIKQKNIDKLVFVDSDEESTLPANIRDYHVQSSRQPRKNHDLTLFKRMTLANEFKPVSSGLRPSLMRTTSENEDEYDSVANCESSYVPHSNKINFLSKRQSVPMRSNNYLDQLINQRDQARENNEKHDRIIKKKQINQTAEDIQSTCAISHKLREREVKLESKQEKLSIPQLQITSLYFEVSDEESPQQQQDNNDPSPIKQPEPKAIHLSHSKQTTSAEQSANEVHAELQQPAKIDITDVRTNPVVDKRSDYLERLLMSKPSPQEVLNAVFSPILPGTKQVFEVHVYSSFSEKEYYFWLNMGAQMRLMMKAKKSTKLHKTEFEILTIDSQSQQFVETCKIVSNLDRSRFNIFKNDRAANRKRVLGTLITSVTFSNAKLLVLYHPAVKQKNTPVVFYEDQAGLDLQQLYRENKKGGIDYTISSRLAMTTKLNIMSHYELRASQKSMEFKNNSGDINLIIGKRGSKRYKIISGPGLTPVQIFSMVIVQIET